MAWLTKERRERIARWNNWGKGPPPPITREQLAANARFGLRFIALPLYALIAVVLLIPVISNDGHPNGTSTAFYVAATAIAPILLVAGIVELTWLKAPYRTVAYRAQVRILFIAYVLAQVAPLDALAHHSTVHTYVATWIGLALLAVLVFAYVSARHDPA